MAKSSKRKRLGTEEWVDPDNACEKPGLSARKGSWFGYLVRQFWPILVIPVMLTILFSTFQSFDRPIIYLYSFLVNLIISACIGGGIVGLYTLAGRTSVLRSRSRVVYGAAHLGVLTFGLVAGVELALFILANAPFLPTISIPRENIYRIGAVIIVVVWTIELTFGRMKAKAMETEKREERARRDAIKAQLESLQARTDPHFLYNSLNTVAGLIEEDPELAESVLGKLSDQFRYALEGSKRERVPLGTELGAIRSYLEVEALRLGDRLTYDLDIEPDIDSLSVPPLILQPLVENAILHGVAPRVEGGTVSVRAARNNGSLELTVENDGPGPGESKHSGTGSSLSDLRERLLLLYGERGELKTGSSKDGGFVVQIRLPLENEESDPQ